LPFTGWMNTRWTVDWASLSASASMGWFPVFFPALILFSPSSTLRMAWPGRRPEPMNRGQSAAAWPWACLPSVEWSYWGFQGRWDGKTVSGPDIAVKLFLIPGAGGRLDGAVTCFRVVTARCPSWSSGVQYRAGTTPLTEGATPEGIRRLKPRRAGEIAAANRSPQRRNLEL